MCRNETASNSSLITRDLAFAKINHARPVSARSSHAPMECWDCAAFPYFAKTYRATATAKCAACPWVLRVVFLVNRTKKYCCRDYGLGGERQKTPNRHIIPYRWCTRRNRATSERTREGCGKYATLGRSGRFPFAGTNAGSVQVFVQILQIDRLAECNFYPSCHVYCAGASIQLSDGKESAVQQEDRCAPQFESRRSINKWQIVRH